jgi:hypothetical protein
MLVVLRPWLALVILPGCHLIGGTDGLFIVEDDAGAAFGGGGVAGSTTSTASTSAAGGGGSDGFECTLAEQCPLPDDPCFQPKCTLGDCEFVLSPEGTQCSGGWCSDHGSCVACLDNTHCPGQICAEGFCVEGSCQDGALTGDETDVDCGGSCPPCNNNGACAQPSDCKSGICSSMVCAACTAHLECAGTHYCDLGGTGYCLEKKSAFSGCKNDYECVSNNCDNWLKYCHL